jgi:tRNA(fMet)-specific endonuclease VapC
MKAALIDTDILSMYFKGNKEVIRNFSHYLTKYPQINLSIITYYEILSGLKHHDAHKQIKSFQQFVAQNTVLPISIDSMNISAEKYAELRKQGTPVDDIDLLIAGIAIANDLIMVTNNSKHFGKISGLEICNWSISTVVK